MNSTVKLRDKVTAVTLQDSRKRIHGFYCMQKFSNVATRQGRRLQDRFFKKIFFKCLQLSKTFVIPPGSCNVAISNLLAYLMVGQICRKVVEIWTII